MGTSAPEVLVEIDRGRRRGLRVQVEDGVREAIRCGRLAPGAVVPSTRALAADLGVTRKVVVQAYEQLVAEGHLIARPGAATTVNPAAARRAAAARPAGGGPDVEVDFRPGRPDLAMFPRAAWARAGRVAIRTMPTGDLAYEDPRGLPVLRRALADYLARVRGVSADPAQVIVCAGFAHAFDLILDVLPVPFAVESPGYPGPRHQLDDHGTGYHRVPVDAEGIDVAALRRTPARAVHVTPAHQSPTGVVLSARRRHDLVDWAREVDGYVVEDDYDAEYRYDRRPVGALQGIAPDRVVYCGTTSKTLASGLRLGWLVVPPALVEAVAARRRLTDGATSTILQATFADFVEHGDLDRHLRHTRRVYRQRRDAVLAALGRWLPQATPTGVAAGQNVLVMLPAGVDEPGVVRRALAAGVRVYPLAGFGGDPAAPGLVLGYGSVSAERAVTGIRLLAGCVPDG